PETPDTTGWVVLDGAPDIPGARRHSSLGELAEAIRAGAGTPSTVVARVPERDTAAVAALELVQTWLAQDDLAASRLLAVTERAVEAGPGVPVRPAAAPAWGLLRTAAAEHPGRILLSDVDGPVAGALLAAG